MLTKYVIIDWEDSSERMIIIANLQFIEDKTFKYNDIIKKRLHEYNRSQAGYREKDYQHFYVFDDQTLVGACHTKLASDWCHIQRIYYQDVDVLKALMNDIKDYYGETIEGIQYSTVLKSRTIDFKSIGFYQQGQLEDMPKGIKNVFLLDTKLKMHNIDKNYDQTSSEKGIKIYDNILKKKNNKLRQSLHFSSEVVDIQFVVLDGDQFVGGIYGNFQYDYLFINRLFVDEEYRGQNIATKLMNMIENESAQRGVYNLYLTTFEFQALDFYKGLGYEVVMVIDDYPKGFKEYTIHKNIAPSSIKAS